MMTDSRGSAASRGSSMGRESLVRAMATLRKPSVRTLSIGSSTHVHGTRNTEPMDTRTARRLSGSHELRVSSTASMAKAAAERKMAPMLVVSTTPSMTTMRRASLQISLTAGSAGRRMAQSTPRVSV